MSEQSDHDLLLTINGKLSGLVEEFRRVSNGTGFPRCVERLERIKQLEEELDKLAGELKAAKATTEAVRQEAREGRGRIWKWLYGVYGALFSYLVYYFVKKEFNG